MKKLMNIFVLVAAAAMTLASCQKNEIDGPVKQEVHFTINAGIAETKTIITDNGDGTYTPSWRKEDKIGIFFTEPTEKVSKVEAEFSNTKEDGETASFEGTASVEGEGTFYAFYPSSAFNQHYGDGTIRLDLPASQKPTSTSFDPACDILVAQPCGYIADGETVVIDNLYFARLMSVLRVNLVGEYAKDQIVESFSVEVDVNANVDITGNAKVDYKNATISAWNNGNVNRNVVTATYTNEEYITIAGTNNAAYLVVAPVTIPSGTTLTFTIETEDYDIVKTVTAPADMVMPAGNIAVINLTIAEENCTAKTEDTSDYSGEWLIAGKEGETWYAAQKYVSGNYLSVTALEFEGESILESDGLSDCYMHIEKVVGGDYDGMYTIVDAGGKYLATSSSDNNYMKAESSASVNTYWTIVKDDAKGTYSIVASKSDYTRNDMRFNYNNGTNSRVSCYDGTKTAQPYLALFSTSLVMPDTTPKLELGEESIELTAAGGEGTIAVTAKNLPADIQVRALTAEGAQNEVEWLTAEYADGVITYTAEANESTEARPAYIEVYVSDDLKTGVSVTQAGKVQELKYYEKVTSSPSDWSGTYLIVYEATPAYWDGSKTPGTSTGQMGSTSGMVKTTISDGKIQSNLTVDKSVIVIEKSGTNYSLKAASGSYMGMSTNNNGLKSSSTSSTYLHTITLESNNTVSILSSDGYTKVAYNKSSEFFRYYKVTTISGNQTGYPLPCLYKLVTNNDAGGETPVEKTLESIAVSDAKTKYTVDDEFVEPTVTATYSDGSTEDVTASAEFTGYNMSAADTYTVTVSYSGKTTTYSITVSAAQGGGDEGGDSVEQTATFNFKQIYIDNNNTTTSNVTVGDITFVGEKGTGSTPARAWSDGLRLYAGCKVTFKAADGYVITSISGDTALAFTGSQQTVEFSSLSKKTISANIVVTYKLQ